MPETTLEELDVRGDLPEDVLSRNFQRDLDSARNYFESDIQQTWADALKHWQGKHLKEPIKGRSKLFIRKPRNIAQRVQATILDAFFSNPDELVSVSPGRKNFPGDIQAAALRQAYLNYRLTTTIPWFKIIHSSIDDLITFNLVSLNIEWVKRVEKLTIKTEGPVINPLTGQPILDPQTGLPQIRSQDKIKEFLLQNEPVVRLVPPERIKLDPRVDWINPYGQFIIHEDFMSLQDIALLAESDTLIDMDNVLASPAASHSQDIIEQGRRNLTADEFDEPDRREVKVYKYFYQVAGKWWKAWMDDDNRILRKTEIVKDKHGKPPFVFGFLTPESHLFYSDSILSINRDYFIFKNGWRNMRIDNAVRIMNRHTVVSRQANADLASLTNKRAGGQTLVDGDVRAAISQEDMPDLSASSYNEEVLVDRDIEEGSGVTEIGQGLTSRTKELATQTLAREQNVNIKEAANIRIVADTLIVSACEMILALAEQHESDESIMQIVGETAGFAFADDNVPTLQNIQGRYSVRVRAGLGSMNRNTRLQNMDVAINRIVKAYGPIAAIPLLSDYLNLLGVKNVDEVVEHIKGFILLQARTQSSQKRAKPRRGANGSPSGNGNNKMTNDFEEMKKAAGV